MSALYCTVTDSMYNSDLPGSSLSETIRNTIMGIGRTVGSPEIQILPITLSERRRTHKVPKYRLTFDYQESQKISFLRIH